MLLILTTYSFSQSLTSQDYLKKSKDQKTAAWVCLGGGSVLIITGFSMFTLASANNLFVTSPEEYENKLDPGIAVLGAGFLSVIGSIPLFIVSSKNKKSGMAASAYIKLERTQVVGVKSLTPISFPALSIKIRL